MISIAAENGRKLGHHPGTTAAKIRGSCACPYNKGE
jgi:hypothetical protein